MVRTAQREVREEVFERRTVRRAQLSAEKLGRHHSGEEHPPFGSQHRHTAGVDRPRGGAVGERKRGVVCASALVNDLNGCVIVPGFVSSPFVATYTGATVTGASWLDREWSTSALGAGATFTLYLPLDPTRPLAPGDLEDGHGQSACG